MLSDAWREAETSARSACRFAAQAHGGAREDCEDEDSVKQQTCGGGGGGGIGSLCVEATAVGTGEGGGGTTFTQLIGDFASTLNTADQTARAAMTGQADPHALVQALSASSLAVETAVTVRDKVVEAYQEILRMPV